jgi:signal transduction histidine kinase
VAEVQSILTDIVAADRRAGEVIGRLRALLKPGHISLQPLPLKEIFDDVLRLINADLIGRAVKVECELDPNLPPIAGDRIQLQQLVLNLILNGADAMAANEPARRRLFIRSELRKDRVCASVQDEGCGLPTNVEQLFQPFYSTKPQGLGMGLAICRSIIDAHQGRLWAKPRPEGGAVFCFELPIAESTEER